MIATVIAFDFDGVLVDSNAVKKRAFFDIFAHFEGAAEDVAVILGRGDHLDRFEVIAAVLGRLTSRPGGSLSAADHAATLADRYNDICEEHVAVCPEIPGASAAISVLAEFYPLYVNSATPQEPLRRIVERRGWHRFFQDVLGRPRTKVENLAWILDHAGVRAPELVFVGDSAGDLTAAQEVGCQFLGVRDDSSELRARGVKLVDDLRGLPALLGVSSRIRAC